MKTTAKDDRFKEARIASYDSPYSRLIAGALKTFSSITSVKDDDFGSSLGAAMQATTNMTLESMDVSDEQMALLEKELSNVRLKTSNRLASMRKVTAILTDVLGEDIITDDKVEALISIVNNKYENFLKVQARLSEKSAKLYNAELLSHNAKINSLTDETTAASSATKTIYNNSMARRFSTYTSKFSDNLMVRFKDQPKTQGVIVRSVVVVTALLGYKLGASIRSVS